MNISDPVLCLTVSAFTALQVLLCGFCFIRGREYGWVKGYFVRDDQEKRRLEKERARRNKAGQFSRKLCAGCGKPHRLIGPRCECGE